MSAGLGVAGWSGDGLMRAMAEAPRAGDDQLYEVMVMPLS
jgi:hypothetical protein